MYEGARPGGQNGNPSSMAEISTMSKKAWRGGLDSGEMQ